MKNGLSSAKFVVQKIEVLIIFKKWQFTFPYDKSINLTIAIPFVKKGETTQHWKKNTKVSTYRYVSNNNTLLKAISNVIDIKHIESMYLTIQEKGSLIYPESIFLNVPKKIFLLCEDIDEVEYSLLKHKHRFPLLCQLQ